MEKQTAGRDALNDFAPKFAELNDDVLFGEVWSREAYLSLKIRSIVTDQQRNCGQFTELPSFCRTKKRCHKDRNGRDPDACCILCRLAECLGGISSGKRGVCR